MVALVHAATTLIRRDPERFQRVLALCHAYVSMYEDVDPPTATPLADLRRAARRLRGLDVDRFGRVVALAEMYTAAYESPHHGRLLMSARAATVSPRRLKASA